MKMVTDPARQRRTDTGNPEVCPVFAFQQIFNTDLTAEIATQCKNAGIGCVDCKKKFLSKLLIFVAPIREKRESLIRDHKRLQEIIDLGTKKASIVAAETMRKVKEIIKI